MSNLQPHIQKLLEDRYYLRDEEGNLLEDSLEQMFMRVAFTVAQAEEDIDSQTYWSENFLDLMLSNKFLPNTPTLINAGKSKPGCFSACFVLPVEDSMPGIFEAVKQSAIIMKAGGGVGYSFGRLREKGSIVKTTGHKASGPVSFMAAFDSMIDTVAQGGSRRGAAIAVLPVWHPDIEEFIEMKDNGDFTNFNISVGITDDFMRAVEEDRDYFLYHYINDIGEAKQTKARDLWNKIVEHAWKTGDPGLIFLDTINKAHPLEEDIEATNPCLHGATLLMDKNGLRRIDEGNGELYKAWYTGDKEVVRLDLSNGQYIICTPNHQIHIAYEGFIEAKDTLGKKVEIKPLDSDYKPEKHPLNPEDILTGFLFGDGFICGNGEGFSVKLNPAKEADVAAMLEEAGFNWQKSGAYYKKYDTVINYQLLGVGSLAKRIPLEYLADYTKLRGFLKGLFEANGSVHSGRVSFKTISKKLATDIQIALNAFEIFSYITTNKAHEVEFENGNYDCRESYDLNIGDVRSIRIFREIIGFISREKSEKVWSIARVESKRDYWPTVKSITTLGVKAVYDFKMRHGFPQNSANGIIAHNCGEIPLRPYESCNLGSINLMEYLSYLSPVEDCLVLNTPIFNWDALAEDIPTMVRFLDDVIDVNPFPLPEIDKASKESRKIGLGIMGWADCLIKMHIPYDSQEAIDLAEELMLFVKSNAIKASSELGKEKGLYPLCKHGGEGFGRDRRNTTLLCVAPTGTLSRIAGVSSGIEPIFSWHIHHKLVDLEYDEVHWSLDEFAKSCPDNDLPQYMKTANEISWQSHLNMQAAFQKFVDNSISKTINLSTNATIDDVSDTYMLAWKYGLKGITIYRDNCKENQPLNKMHSGGVIDPNVITAPKIDTASYLKKEYFHTLTKKDGKKYETKIGDHSKTLGPIIKMALEEGSGVYKGDKKIADFSPEHTPLISKATKEEVALVLSDTFPSVEEQIQKYRKRGPVAPGVTHKVDTGKGKIYITINYDEHHSEPVEAFIRLSYASTSNELALAEWAGRLVSLLLKHNVPLEAVIRQGSKVFGDAIFWYNNNSFSSFPRLISHLLGFTFDEAMIMAGMDFEAMMENGSDEEAFDTVPEDDEEDERNSSEVERKLEQKYGAAYCYECGEYAIIDEGGCKVCQNCGFEECG